MAQIASLLVAGKEEEWGTITEALNRAGLSARCLSAVSAAQGVLAKERFDAILLDFDLLETQGLELLKIARGIAPEIISLTAAGSKSLAFARQAMEAGAYALLPKPCPAPVLQRVLEQALERQALVKDLRVRNRALETLNREMDSKIEESTRELRSLNEHLLTEMASLREVDKLKSSFLANVTHDLINPLTSLRAYILYLIENAELTAEERTICLQNARSSLSHMEYLINQLLEAARLSSGKIKLNLEDAQVAELLVEAGTLVMAKIQENHIHFKIVPDSNKDLTLCADRGRLLQVLSNLLSNACKFTPKDGQITLRGWAEKESVHFCVEDSGIGIAIEHQARVFERFYQVDSAQSKSFKGLGLGLRIAKDLVELHQGRIWVESQPGMGSRFHFLLPCRGPDAPSSP